MRHMKLKRYSPQQRQPIHNHTTRFKTQDHLFCHKHGGLFPRNQGCCDDDIVLADDSGQFLGLSFFVLFGHFLSILVAGFCGRCHRHINKRRPQTFNVFFDGRTYIKRRDARTQTSCCCNRLETGHTSSQHQNTGGGDCASSSHHHGEKSTVKRSCFDNRTVPQKVTLRGQNIHRLRTADALQKLQAQCGDLASIQCLEEFRCLIRRKTTDPQHAFRELTMSPKRGAATLFSSRACVPFRIIFLC
ncbi:hypothetical protein FGO68_gene11733 [Halteria grandinella]|uniref:Uncharacterized protein n=1 Tax=Halteria grandinella TaxID=5974 RepID=A0A8J8NAX1_HALGN|nr:hypothetical protein FGO68_gene11733 [Halteria grandinella]